MKKNNFTKGLIFCLVMLLFTLVPNLGVKAETNKNFSVIVQTDKAEYSYEEVVTYKVTVKNVSDKESKDLKISKELPQGIIILETDGDIKEQTVTWTKENLKQNEEVTLNLKVKLEHKDTGTKPPEGEDDNDEVKPIPPSENLPNTGGNSSSMLLIIGVAITLLGVWIYKHNGAKSTISLLLAFIFTTSLISSKTINVYAKDISITEEFVHSVKVDDEEITSKILVQAIIIDEEETDDDLLNPENPKWDLDSDKDGISDAEEELFGTNPNNSDSDEDGLKDKFELEANLDPLKKDTDDNGILDGDEDIDEDKLSNLEEQQYNTNPRLEDSDSDKLSDYDEIKIYNTDPNKIDSDDDNLTDYYEITLGTNPNNVDSNGNGINDGDESYNTKITPEEYEKDENIEVTISGNIKGEYIDDIIVANMEGTHPYITEDIPGYIGAPFRVEIFEDGAEQDVTLSFVVNKELINQQGRIALYEYDKEKMILKEVTSVVKSLSSNEIIINTKLINEYKEYIILMADKWEEAWNKDLLEPGTEFKELDVVLTIDSSGSMEWNDPSDLRKVSSIKLINRLEGNNRAAVVDFDSSAIIRQGLTTDKNALISAINRIDSSGGTDISFGLAKSINAIDINSRSVLNSEIISRYYETLEEDSKWKDTRENQVSTIESEEDTSIEESVSLNSLERDKYIILLTDGQSYVSQNDPSLVYARKHGIKIFTIGLGSEVNERILRMIASTTGGKYLFATSADDLEQLFDELITQTIDLYTDSDDDGIPNYFERNLRLRNGVILQLDPNNPDTDGDGLSDGFEICGYDKNKEKFFNQYNSQEKSFNYLSRPDLRDTDKDHIADGNGGNLDNGSTANILDKEPRIRNVSERTILKFADLSYAKLKKEHVNGKVKDIPAELGAKEHTGAISRSDIDYWKVMGVNNGNGFLAGAGILAALDGRTLIVSYAGTGLDISDIIADIQILMDILRIANYQTKPAKDFMNKVLIELKGKIDNIYITGHSLGGYLSQYMTYQCVENTFNNKELIKGIKVKGMTFNSATFGSPGVLIDNFKPVVGFDKNIFGDSGKYKDYITNYRIELDPISSLEIGMNLGVTKELKDTILDIPFLGAHSLYNFYDHIGLKPF